MDFGTGHDALADEHHDGHHDAHHDAHHDGELSDIGDGHDPSADGGGIGHLGEPIDAGLGPAIFDELIHGLEDLLDRQPAHGTTGDAVHDLVQPGRQHDPGAPDPMDPQAWAHPYATGPSATGPDGSHDDLGLGAHPGQNDAVDGNPHAWANDWFFQETDGYCGPSSIAQVVSEYTGLDVHDPQQLADRAAELGVFDPNHPENGMTWQGMQTLMQDQGVPCHLQQSSMPDLEAKLDDGYGVIAMVNAGTIWGQEHDPGQGSDHALVVAGIDHDRGMVILSDPGNPNGNQEEVPIDRFEQAWAASGDEMLVADSPDPDLASPQPAAAPADAAATGSASSSETLESVPWAIANLTGTP